MASSDNPLDQVVVGQYQPAVIVNELLDAMSPAALFGRRGRTSTGLTWGYYGGRYNGLDIDHDEILLTGSAAVVYIVANKTTGVVTQSTSDTNWLNTTDYDHLYTAVTSSTAVTSWVDYREGFTGSGGGGGGGAVDWGDIGGTLSDQTDLDTALSGKADASHTHATGDVTGLQEYVEDTVAALFAAGTHTDITVTYNDGTPSLALAVTGGGGGSPISIADEGVEITAAPISIDFVGAGVTADSDTAGNVTVTIAGGGGGGGGWSEGPGLSGATSTPGWHHLDTASGKLYIYTTDAGAFVEF